MCMSIRSSFRLSVVSRFIAISLRASEFPSLSAVFFLEDSMSSMFAAAETVPSFSARRLNASLRA